MVIAGGCAEVNFRLPNGLVEKADVAAEVLHKTGPRSSETHFNNT